MQSVDFAHDEPRFTLHDGALCLCLCMTPVQMLLHMTNQYALGDFDSVRLDALVAVTAACPVVVGEYITEQVCLHGTTSCFAQIRFFCPGFFVNHAMIVSGSFFLLFFSCFPLVVRHLSLHLL